MLYTKELVSGRDIDLTKYDLDVIRQLRVDDLMGELDIINFIKPYYLERNWRVNGLLKENDSPFTLFLMAASKNNELLAGLIESLKLLYSTELIELKDYGNGDFKFIIKKIIDEKIQAIAFIDDSNFDVLCKTILTICYYPEPTKEEKEEIKGDPELVAMVKKAEEEYKKKHDNKNTVHFEEIVRQVMHIRKCSYDDIKNMTVWQLQDSYKTYLYMENTEREWGLASSGNFKIKEVKRWQDLTKIMREDAN